MHPYLFVFSDLVLNLEFCTRILVSIYRFVVLFFFSIIRSIS